jgi:hypothetical protein
MRARDHEGKDHEGKDHEGKDHEGEDKASPFRRCRPFSPASFAGPNSPSPGLGGHEARLGRAHVRPARDLSRVRSGD